MADFAIGAIEFISLTRPPEAPGEEPQVFARAGVDGVAIFKTGVRGKEFRLESVVDVAGGVSSASALYRGTYIPARGTVVTIKWNGVTPATTYLVKNVDLVSITPARSPVGGLVAGEAVLRSSWTLQPVTA